MNKVLIHSKKSTNKAYVLIFNRQVSMFSFNAEDAGRWGAKHGIYAVPRARGAVYGGFAPHPTVSANKKGTCTRQMPILLYIIIRALVQNGQLPLHTLFCRG